jgi:hypothetical protein
VHSQLLGFLGTGTLVPGAGDVLRRTPVRRAVDRVTGTVQIALGVRLALSRR